MNLKQFFNELLDLHKKPEGWSAPPEHSPEDSRFQTIFIFLLLFVLLLMLGFLS